MHGLKPALIGLYVHVLKSYRSTLLGLVVAAVAYGLMQAQASPNPYARLIAGAILVPFLAWKDRAVAQGTIRLVSIIALVFFAGAARAQGAGGAAPAAAPAPAKSSGTLADVAPSDPTMPTPSQFGGCTKSGKVCFGPSLSISVAAINLSTGKIEGAFSPGVGYGFTVNPGKWTSFGLALHLVVDPGAQQASASLLAKIFNGYFRPGISKGFVGDTSLRLLGGTGVDF